MAPTILFSLLSRSLSARGHDDVVSAGPLAARSNVLESRDTPNFDPHAGSIAPTDINNNALFALFGVIGAAFVVVGIWFFFWAKNGGFHFRKDDWSDYKTTVLRRRGPNGTILSNATPSTNLGGGSIYKDVDDGSTEDTRTVLSGSTAMTGITAGVSDIGAREKRRKKKEQRERERERRREEKEREKAERKQQKTAGGAARKVNAEGVLIDEDAEAEAKAHLRKYRHERPARVGGLNKEGDGSTWDGSTNPASSTMSGSGIGSTVTSELISHRERTPTHTPTKRPVVVEPSAVPGGGSSGIRKVYSTADKNASREGERIRAEARRLQERGRAAAAAASSAGGGGPSSRRDFSWQHADETSHLRGGGGDDDSGDIGTQVPGSWAESDVGTSSDVGTKVYKHSVHIPGTASATSTSDFAYQEEKRKRRGGAGYRRGQE